MKSLYLLLNLFTISFPLIRSFEHRIQYAKKWKALLPGLIITASFFIIWDVQFTKSGIWGFNPLYLSGIYVFDLPIEEWLFFITVPFASIFIYECVIYYLPGISSSKALQVFSLIISVVLIFLSVLHHDLAYTFWNFLFGGIFLMIIVFTNPAWLGKFWIAYLLHLIPFFIVNGVLTGSFINEEVVWYNNQENLSIRMWTIPIEDTIYSMLLLLMNVAFFERFKKYFSLKQRS